VKLFDDFTVEAARVRDRHASKIRLFIGFESEWIRPESLDIIRDLLEKYTFDLFMGSVHHVHTIPIDYDKETYVKAREKAGGSDERLFEDYFDSQYEMLQSLKPPVVGHFDLIRLMSDTPNTDFEGLKGVWQRIQRNLEYIASYGGILELNSSALRKGLAQPYPCLPICEVCHTAWGCSYARSTNACVQLFLRLNGRFTISDDSHGVDQLGTNYPRLLEFVLRAGIRHIFYADSGAPRKDSRFPNAGFSSIAVDELGQLPFWKSAR
jgi:histidinol-phosphatase (PHP family)